jgi:predicted acylesterase/phospholipase RssA/CRP-like cAMP-binding protein
MIETWRREGLFCELAPELEARVAAELTEITFAPGEQLFRRGDPSDAVYMIESGTVEIVHDDHAGPPIAVLERGDPIGEVQFLTGGRRTATARARESTKLVRLDRTTFENVAKAAPIVREQMIALIRRRLRRYRLHAVLPHILGASWQQLLGDIEREAKWIRLRRGERLIDQGARDQSVYVLMRGRLQAEVATDGGGRQVIGQIHPGESVGEMALFTGELRAASVHAARDSEVIRLSPEAVHNIAARHPDMVIALTRLIIRRFRQTIGTQPSLASATGLVLLPITPGFPLGDFAERLVAAMAPSSVLRLSSDIVDELLETPGIAHMPEHDPNAMLLDTWLDEQDSRYSYIVYELDPKPTPWSWRCIRRADRVVLVGDASKSPERGDLEHMLLDAEQHTRPPCTLALVHDDATALPSGTARWLARPGVARCVHLRRSRDADFARFGRILTGRAIALVLSGGGAKGFAHLGVLQALEEHGVPIDMIGGSSMGSVIAAGYATGGSPRELADVSRRLFATYKPFREYTLPLISVFRGRRLDRMLRQQFGDANIEDCWLGYFCMSTDLTAGEPRVHASGSLFTAVRASISIPGVLPPVIDGDRLLVDGGMVDNLPGDVMRGLSQGTLIAIDVAPRRAVVLSPGFAEYPSPWRVLWNRLLPKRWRKMIPTIPHILARTTTLGNIDHCHSADWYLRPDVERYGLLQFDAIDEIVEDGYRHTLDYVAAHPEMRP